MPSERYIPPTAAETNKWHEERVAKEKLDALRSELIEAALRKLKKDELIDLLMSLDTYDPSVRWSIEAEIQVKKPVNLVVHDLRHAIEIATKVDKSKVNTNFPCSWQAYEETGRGFQALLDLGEVEMAKSIAVEFMNMASYQVACSDEGDMVEQIEDCLQPLIKALQDDASPSHRTWAIEMLMADQVGFICASDLQAMLPKD